MGLVLSNVYIRGKIIASANASGLSEPPVGNAPVSSFDMSIEDQGGSIFATFADTSTNGPTSWLWDFGDGATSTLQNPTHLFETVGTFTITLTATNAAGSNISEIQSVTVLALVLTPVASFTKSGESGTIPFTVSFTDTSTNTPTSWLWSFGDGDASTVQHPTHSYTTAGTFNATVKATNSAGDNTSVSQVITTTAPVSVLVTANHTYDATGSAVCGWDRTISDYTGSNGTAVFKYYGSSNGVQTFYSNGTRTTYLPYKANTKYYMEVEVTAVTTYKYWLMGIAADSTVAANYTASPGIYANDSTGRGGPPNLAAGAFAAGTVIMIAYDTATNQVYFGKNGVWPINPVGGTGTVIPGVSTLSPPRLVFCRATATNVSNNVTGIFRSGTFIYTPPTGYVAAVA